MPLEAFQQRVLCLEMRIEGCSANIRPVDDLLHGDLRIAFLFQQPGEGPKDGLPGFSLPAVHSPWLQKGCLVRYLEEHRPEVEKIMMTMFSTEYVKMTSERTEKIKEDISAYRFINVPEAQIKDAIIRRYDLTPAYAQNFLDDDSDPEDSRPWAL